MKAKVAGSAIHDVRHVEKAAAKAEAKAEAKELHKPVIRKFPRRKVLVHGVNDTWAADLIDMQKFEKHNKHNRYILTVIDVLSRYAYAEPIKDKKPHTIINAFQKILQDSGTPPKKLWVDQGSEFINSQMKRFISPIEIYHTFSESKAVPVERFNRTLKTRIWLKFTTHDTQEWLSRLPKLMTKYNNTVHSSIGMTPAKARTHEKELLALQTVNASKDKYKEPKLQCGDMVRLAKTKKAFHKGFEAGWTKELFRVCEIIHSSPVTYRVEDQKGEVIKGSMYEQEIHKSQGEWTPE